MSAGPRHEAAAAERGSVDAMADASGPTAEYLEDVLVFLNGEALEPTEAAAEVFAARVPAHAPATRQFTNTSKEKLLKRLQADPELVTAEGYKQFGYSGPCKLKGD